MSTHILVVDDEPLIGELIKDWLTPLGYAVTLAGTAGQAMERFGAEAFSLVMLDNSLPDATGVDVFHAMRQRRGDLPVLFVTGFPNWEQGVDLMRKGACDYLAKPFSRESIVSRVEQVLSLARLQAEVSFHRARGRAPEPSLVIGRSPGMQEVARQIDRLARFPHTTVLLTGETGTGKGMVARHLHELTCGTAEPFVDIDCSTLPRELCESELFGHEKGSFTGAHKAKAGLFEVAQNGTAFLDEIGEIEPPVQVKLLRVIESRQFQRVGGQALLQMSARVIAATNRSLTAMVAQGRFREDLFFRLNVYELHLPPLRERRADVLPLAQHLLERINRLNGSKFEGFDPGAQAFLEEYSFPGNVRELRNLIERAAISATGSLITGDLFTPLVLRAATPNVLLAPAVGVGSLARAIRPDVPAHGPVGGLAATEKALLIQALAASAGNKTRAASALGISRNALLRRLDKHGISGLDHGTAPSVAVAGSSSSSAMPELGSPII